MREVREDSFGIIPLRLSSEKEWELFIILHKQGNHWGFPKGKPNQGEEPKKSASRELSEETGLKVVRFLREDPIVEEYTFYRKKEKVFKRVSYFPALVSGDFLLQPEEVRDGRWETLDGAKDILTFEEAKQICEKVKGDLPS